MSSTDNKAWDEMFADFLDRVMATAVANGDPKPLQEEYARLLSMAPADKKKELAALALENKNATR
jgi:hypothetical protein